MGIFSFGYTEIGIDQLAASVEGLGPDAVRSNMQDLAGYLRVNMIL